MYLTQEWLLIPSPTCNPYSHHNEWVSFVIHYFRGVVGVMPYCCQKAFMLNVMLAFACYYQAVALLHFWEYQKQDIEWVPWWDHAGLMIKMRFKGVSPWSQHMSQLLGMKCKWMVAGRDTLLISFLFLAHYFDKLSFGPSLDTPEAQHTQRVGSVKHNHTISTPLKEEKKRGEGRFRWIMVNNRGRCFFPLLSLSTMGMSTMEQQFTPLNPNHQFGSPTAKSAVACFDLATFIYAHVTLTWIELIWKNLLLLL